MKIFKVLNYLIVTYFFIFGFSTEFVHGQSLCRHLFDSTELSQKDLAKHLEILNDLEAGIVVNALPFSKNNNRQELLVVDIYNKKTGRTQKALFKPRPFGDGQGYNRTPMEFITYKLNLLLGMDLIPPVVYRRNLNANYKNYSEGALIHFVSEPRGLKEIPRENWGLDVDLFLSDTRILDVLIQNSDRHIDNFLYGKHWVKDGYQPLLIDHGAGLRKEAYVTMTHENAFQTGPVEVIRASTFANLKRLKIEDLRKFKEYMSENEMNKILFISKGIVQYFESLIQKNGYSKVVKN